MLEKRTDRIKDTVTGEDLASVPRIDVRQSAVV